MMKKEAIMLTKILMLFSLSFVMVPGLNAQTQMQVYGVWHCYSDGCNWFSVPDMVTFDTDNHWIIDRGNGSPSVNVVVLSFVNPVDLMNLANSSNTKNGIPIGMDAAVVNYFQSKGVRVMFSIGGIRFVKDWDKALNTNPTQLGINAANTAKQFNVGMEIDYEKSSNPNLAALQQFVTAYRSVLPYDSTGNNYAACLTIDLGNDDLFLQPLSAYATTHWLTTSNPVLDYANAMVASQKTTVSTLENGWAQHVDGITGVPPLAPAKLTGSLWLIAGQPNCATFSSSDQKAAANFVETIPPKGAGTTPGMLGFMFWAAGCQGQGTGCTFPPTTCEGGIGVAATTFSIPIPMPTLRQQ
jgi:hypothetical protein